MSKITRREFLHISAVTAAGAILTACGVQATETPTEQQPEAEKPAEAPKVERPKVFPLGDVPRNRTLVFQFSNPMAGNCNPFASGYTHQNGNAIILENGAYYAVHADKNIMWLAESYKYNEDATEMTVVFRKGIKWSDGTPFTAADAAGSMETLKRVPGLTDGADYVNQLVSATAVDDNTLVVKLNQTDWRFFFKQLTSRFDLGGRTWCLPQHIWKDVPDDQLTTFNWYDPAKNWPVTTAAYGVGTSEEQYTNYDLRPTWWAVETGLVQKEPDVWRLQNIPHQNNTVSAQLIIAKEIDEPLGVGPLLITSILAQADHVSSWTGRESPFGYIDWWPTSVQFCTEKYPFDNPKVRWAVAYSLNQQAIVDIAWAGAGEVNNSPFPAYPRLVEYMNGIKDITDQYNVLEFNLDKAAQLMTEAGFTKNADGWWADKDGVIPDSDLYADTSIYGDIAPVIAEQLRTAGFKCEHKAPPDVWAAKVDGRASMFLFGHGGGTIDPYDTFQLYRGENAAPMGEQSWGNITRWDTPEFAAIRDEMNNTAMDDPKMKDLFREAMSIWYAELPDCPILQFYHRIPVSNWYFTNWPDKDNPYMNSALWHQTMIQVILGLKATGNT
jgi:peptide/nickel transport system substrate-binding protein